MLTIKEGINKKKKLEDLEAGVIFKADDSLFMRSDEYANNGSNSIVCIDLSDGELNNLSAVLYVLPVTKATMEVSYD